MGKPLHKEEEVVSEDKGSVRSDCTSTAVERKVLAKVPQSVGTCVVASYTAKARHPEQTVLVPTVLSMRNNKLRQKL